MGFPRGECRCRPLGDWPPLLLRQRSVEVQHERVRIRAKLSDDERNTLGHEAGNEGHVAGEPVELGHQDRTFLCPASGQRCGQLRPSVEGVGALARFRLDELAHYVEPFHVGESHDGRALRHTARVAHPNRTGSPRAHQAAAIAVESGLHVVGVTKVRSPPRSQCLQLANCVEKVRDEGS